MEHFLLGFKYFYLFFYEFFTSNLFFLFLGMVFGLVCLSAAIVTIIETFIYIKTKINEWRK